MRVLVVDDEAPARVRMRQLLEDLPGWDCCGEASTGEQALRELAQTEPDVVLLDIRMPGMDGLETARHLASLDEPPAVIFTTAYGEHALEAFETQAVGYLLKPLRREALQEALHSACRVTRAQLSEIADEAETEEARTHICARVRGGLQLVPVSQILYFQADNKYVTVRHRDGEVLIDDSLRQLEEEFGDAFIRIHRNALVARKYLGGIEKHSGTARVRLLDCEETLEVSRRHLPGVRRELKALDR